MSTIMTYTDKMDQLDHQMMDEVLRLRESFNPDAFTKEEVFSALEKDSLTKEDFMALLSPAAAPYLEEMARRARAVTKARFGDNITLFTPLYIANYCSNGCLYCGFNSKNKIKRAKLDMDQIKRELEGIAQTGLQDILILTGESEALSPTSYIAEAISLAKPYFANIGIEIYPTNEADYRLLHQAGADFVKTSTGFSTGGATLPDVQLMRQTVGPDMGVKAAGGARSYADAVAFVEAGATRIGTSSGVAILKGELADGDY